MTPLLQSTVCPDYFYRVVDSYNENTVARCVRCNDEKEIGHTMLIYPKDIQLFSEVPDHHDVLTTHDVKDGDLVRFRHTHCVSRIEKQGSHLILPIQGHFQIDVSALIRDLELLTHEEATQWMLEQ
ncbi:hypothetical protein [Terriglobus roseus]|uniref:Uncharacterized protein n=1 Tax=Terriglobus roseus TaxID=392734 RepID=A0A1G7G653_9BACT|nr:hypothetical protein [Terriglobus roseus]SDE83583.1 hypothetical protein SAMN05444167_0569 [Terriglobus roseus]